MKYLRGTFAFLLTFRADNDFHVTGYSDSDCGARLDSKKSLTGYCIVLGSSLTAWKAKKQTTVSRSSAKAEYRDMATTTVELLWISYILKEFHFALSLPITLYCDNQSSIKMVENLVFFGKQNTLVLIATLLRLIFKMDF